MIKRGPWGLLAFGAMTSAVILASGVSTAVAGGYPLFLRMAGVRDSQLDESGAGLPQAAGVHLTLVTHETETNKTPDEPEASQPPKPNTEPEPTPTVKPAASPEASDNETETESPDPTSHPTPSASPDDGGGVGGGVTTDE